MSPRKIFVLALLGGSLVPAASGNAAQQGEPEIVFDITRKGDTVGRHSLDFTRDGDRLVVDIAIDIEVKLAFITVYRYEHRAKEIWSWDGSTLLWFSSATSDNGKKSEVIVERRDGALHLVAGDAAQRELSEGYLPTTYWHPATRRADALLNSQKGEVAEVDVAPAGPQEVALPAGAVRAERFEVRGDLSLNLAYNEDGCLVGLDFTPPKGGSEIVYRVARYFQSSDADIIAAQPLVGHCAKLADRAS